MSKFIVVHEATGARGSSYKNYATQKGANNFAEKLNKQVGEDLFVAISEEYYTDVLSKRTTVVKNLLTGKPVTIPLVDKGTCVDPSTERYFCC